MTTSRAGRNNRTGFTLIELLVTLALVGLLMGLAVGQMGKLLSWDMKGTARKLSSTIRYLYNKSASEGVTLRLVLDIDNSSYSVEGTSERFTLTREEERSTKHEARSTKKEEESTAIQPKEASFGPQESFLLKPVTLPKGIFFKDVYAEHQIAPLKEGKAFIYFFPRGYVERSVINLRDSKDAVHYSLQVSPISGSVKIEPTYKEAEVEK